MSNQLYSNATKLYPFNQSLFPDIDNSHDFGSSAKRWANLNCVNCSATSISTSVHTVDDIIMDITNQDVKLSRSAISTLLVDNNAGGDATISAAVHQVDANFKMQLTGGNPNIQMDSGGDGVTYNRTTNQMDFKVNGGPVELSVFDGYVSIREKLQFNSNQFIQMDTPSANDWLMQFNSGDTFYWDNSTNVLGIQIGYTPIINFTATQVQTAKDFVPTATQTYNVGSTALNFKRLYLNDANNMIISPDSTGTFAVGGTYNIGIGTSVFANAASATATNNIGVGYRNFRNITSGTQNTSIGYGASAAMTSGGNNVSVGAASLASNIISSNNTAVGSGALYAATGGSNTATGMNAGNAISTGSGNTIIGSNANVTTGAAINRLAIGISASCSTDYSAQIQQATVSGSNAICNFRTQKISDETWINSKIQETWIDASGNIVKGQTIGTVTQLTSLTTAVTLNSIVGKITTVTATLVPADANQFTVNNSNCAAGDLVQVWIDGYSGAMPGAGIPEVSCQGVGSGYFGVNVCNVQSVNSLNGTITIGFRVIKA